MKNPSIFCKGELPFYLKKILLIMRLTTILLIINLLQVSAIGFSQSARFTLQMNNVSIKEALQIIESQSTYKFVYRDGDIENQVVSLKAKESSIDQVMESVLSNTGSTYKLLDNNLVVIIPSSSVQEIKITGKVTDANTGETLPGVSIGIEGSATGVITDVDGNYTLQLTNPEATLVFSFIGYNTERIAVQGRSKIDVALVPDIKSLDEVVVVGYGTQKRGSVTGSVTSINADEIELYPASNLSNLLAGRLSGVIISQGTGKPGSSSTFSIRAQGTINNSDPLFVIDGIVRDKFAFDGLDASEVENISVLKDGASAAIYGSRAANGVVLVTTKKGKTGKPEINYSYTAGLETPTMIPETMSAFDHATYMNDGSRNSYYNAMNVYNKALEAYNANPVGKAPTLPVDPTTQTGWFTDDELEFFKTSNFDWFEDSWRDPRSARHVLNINGGSDAVRYFVGGSYYKESGSFDNLNYNKYSLRANIEANITKNLMASIGLSGDQRHDEKPYWSPDGDRDRMNDLYKGILLRPKFIPSMVNGQPVANGIEWHPLMQISKQSSEHLKDWNDIVADLTLEYKVPWVKGLKLKGMYNNSYRSRTIKQMAFPYTMYEYKWAGTNNHYIDPSYELTGKTKVRDNGSFVKKENQTEKDYQLNGYVIYDFTIGKHAFNTLFVYEQSESSSDRWDAKRNGLLSWKTPEFYAASGDASQSEVTAGSISEGARISYVGRVNYAYADKYLLEVAFREDGSTKFAPEQRWGFFPSASAGWRISSEPFFANNVKLIDYLKLKGSYAELGNDEVGGWQWMERNGITTGAVFENVQLGVQPKELPNPLLTWEKSRSYNVGIEGRLLKQIDFGFEYFYRQTYDILDTRPQSVPTSFGASLPKENYSAIDSRGIEVELGINSNPAKKFSYYARGNFSYAKSWWVKRDEASNMRPYLSEIGQPIGRVWGYQNTGMIRTPEDLAAIMTVTPGMKVLGSDPVEGMLMYKDIRGINTDDPDGLITTDDKVVVINNINPTMTYGLSLGGQWKGISLDVFFQGLAGHEKLVGLGLGGINYTTNTFTLRKDHWTPDNRDAEQPSPSGGKNGENSTFWVKDASFLRLKAATLAYTFPRQLTQKIGIKKANIFVTGTNLFLLVDNMKWMDPESTNLTDYPIMRTFSLGLNLTL